VTKVKKKILALALAVAMLALPMSVVSAKKPEKFFNVTFYGYPGAIFGGDATFETYGVGEGKSANNFIIWLDPTDWCYCESYIPMGDPPVFFTPVDDFATGFYTGKWILHGSHINVHGIYDMEITDWMGTGKTGNLVVLGGGNKLTIIGGTIDGQKVHGHGTSTEIIFMTLYEYTFTLHFEP
jgi:hypothetical protein